MVGGGEPLTPSPGPVRFSDTEPSGLATIVGQLISQNIARDPSRLGLLRAGVVSIEALDAGVAITLRFASGSVEVTDDRDPGAIVTVRADAGRLLDLVGAPLRYGLPDALDPAGRAVLADLLARRIVVRGLLRHPRTVVRLTRLLSVYERRPGPREEP